MTPSLSCEKAAELSSLAMDEHLGMLDQFRLKFHLWNCGNCQNVDAQLKQLSRLIQSPDAFNEAETPELNLNIKMKAESWTAP